jgi:hypothetical protein
VYSFGKGFIDDVASRIERRVKMSLSVTERHVYLDLAGQSLTTVIEENRLA